MAATDEARRRFQDDLHDGVRAVCRPSSGRSCAGHAPAGVVDLELALDDAEVRITVADDGAGIEGGSGLIGIADRVSRWAGGPVLPAPRADPKIRLRVRLRAADLAGTVSQESFGRRTSTLPSRTLTRTAGWGCAVGPFSATPSASRYRLECHGQTTHPSSILPSCSGPPW